MRTYITISTSALIALLVGHGSLSAETLEQITAEALGHNPELQVFEQSVAAARGNVRTAKTFSNPELSVAPGFRRTREVDDRKDEFHGEFSLSHLFQFPGKRALEVAIVCGASARCVADCAPSPFSSHGSYRSPSACG